MRPPAGQPRTSPTAPPTASTERAARVAAARKLLRRPGRERAGRFLAEGVQAVRAALDATLEPAADRPPRVVELFATGEAIARHADLIGRTRAAGVVVTRITERAAAGLSETVTPQGLIAVCELLDVPVAEALAGAPRLVAVLVDPADPGNAGTVIRVADAAGADAVLLAGEAVDPHNGKCVRASVGSVFHLPLARTRDRAAALAACRVAGLRVCAATAAGEVDLHDPATDALLAEPTAWLFGSEAHGLPADVSAAADVRIRVPIHGRAESLNLATAAAVCVYATARVQRGG
jgi:TrmH family RNA methyltransferase